MSLALCPACNKESITIKQRLKASHWMDIYCNECGSRFAMQPIVLALMHFVLVWNFYFFGFMAVYEKSIVYAGLFFLGWGILEFFAAYIPLVKLRAKTPKNA
ncbi:MAG: hypothetical protein OEX19_08895 [Gammaproteobacteria bacterium]|nr:hypothetical protein [Gammaproteobacteria bacterium]